MSRRRLLWLLLPFSMCAVTLLSAQETERTKPPVPEWMLDGLLSALNDPEPGVAEYVPFVSNALTQHFDFAVVVHKEKQETLAKRIADQVRKDNGRLWTIYTLGQLGDAAASQTPTLVELLKDRDRSVRDASARALGQLGDAAASQLPALVELLKNRDNFVRLSAASALGQLGDTAASQAPALVELLNDPDSSARRAAASALGQLGDSAASQAPTLVELLKDPDERVRYTAAWALTQLGDSAASLAPTLGELLKDPDRSVRSSVARTLGELGDARDHRLRRSANYSKIRTEAFAARRRSH